MKGSVEKYLLQADDIRWRYKIFISNEKGGRIKKDGFLKKKDADSALRKHLDQLERLNGVQTNIMTVKDFSDDFYEKKKGSDIEITTSERYKLFKNDINKYLGKIKLIELNVLDIEKFYITLRDERKLSNSTIVKTHRYLRMMLDNAEKKMLIDKNPARLADKPAVDKFAYSIWLPDEIESNLIKLKSSYLYDLIYLAVHTGGRLGELLSLTWDDINLTDEVISFNKNLALIDNVITIKKPKTEHSIRKITILEDTLPYMKKMRVRIDTNLVVHDLNGQYWNPKYISKAFRSELKHYGVKSIRFHDLRHTHASWLLSFGVDPKVISQRLGHADVAFTLQTYTHLGLDHQKEEMKKLKNIR